MDIDMDLSGLSFELGKPARLLPSYRF